MIKGIASLWLLVCLGLALACGIGCDGPAEGLAPAPSTAGACGQLGQACCNAAGGATRATCDGELYCDSGADLGPAFMCVSIRGQYGRACHKDGSCDSPALECMSNVIVTMCILPQQPATCGNPGQPCCRTLERDGTLAAPCQGKDNHSCQGWCRSGATCDGSHRNSADNVCVVL